MKHQDLYLEGDDNVVSIFIDDELFFDCRIRKLKDGSASMSITVDEVTEQPDGSIGEPPVVVATPKS